MLLKNIDMPGLNLLDLIYILVFDVEKVLKNAKLTLLVRLELQVFFTSSQLFVEKLFRYLTKTKMSSIFKV